MDTSAGVKAAQPAGTCKFADTAGLESARVRAVTGGQGRVGRALAYSRRSWEERSWSYQNGRQGACDDRVKSAANRHAWGWASARAAWYEHEWASGEGRALALAYLPHSLIGTSTRETSENGTSTRVRVAGGKGIRVSTYSWK